MFNITEMSFEPQRVNGLKSPIFWHIMPCSLLKVISSFGGACPACSMLHAGFTFGLFFDPEDGDDMFL
jgi:hypothetical protein